MSTRTIGLSDQLHAYLTNEAMHESDVLRRLREETAKLPKAGMQISPEQGRFMTLLAEMLDCKRAIEIGVFTGYSALCVASAMPPDGKLIACDISDEWTSIARRYWAEAGVADKIDLRLAPALETLDALIADGQAGTYDFAFIDADKESTDAYYEKCLALLRPGGVVATDNALRNGTVADPDNTEAATVALRTLNAKARDDTRVTASLIPIGDGLLLARKH